MSPNEVPPVNPLGQGWTYTGSNGPMSLTCGSLRLERPDVQPPVHLPSVPYIDFRNSSTGVTIDVPATETPPTEGNVTLDADVRPPSVPPGSPVPFSGHIRVIVPVMGRPAPVDVPGPAGAVWAHITLSDPQGDKTEIEVSGTLTVIPQLDPPPPSR